MTTQTFEQRRNESHSQRQSLPRMLRHIGSGLLAVFLILIALISALPIILLFFVTSVPVLVAAGTVDWGDVERIDWGTLILLGGGLSLADALGETGAIGWFADVAFDALAGTPVVVVVLVVVAGTVASRHPLDAGARSIEFGRSEIAAFLILLCRDRRIPLPHHAEKSLEAEGGGICLWITKSLSLDDRPERSG